MTQSGRGSATVGRGNERLWEADHPYYCSEASYYVGGRPEPSPWGEPGVPYDHVEFDSWAEFGWKDADPDYNLLFRWDWNVCSAAEDEDEEDLPRERLVLFWMLQRKGRFMITSFPVRRDEEPEIREWLDERFRHLLKVWSPFSAPSATVGTEAR
jgi:hypothetical protein